MKGNVVVQKQRKLRQQSAAVKMYMIFCHQLPELFRELTAELQLIMNEAGHRITSSRLQSKLYKKTIVK